MPRFRDHSLAVAACASLVAHALLLRTLASAYLDTVGDIRTPPLAEAPPFTLIPPAAVPKSEDDIGEINGTGQGISSTPGDHPLKARKGDEEQAFLSRDPEGPGKVGDLPSPNLTRPGDAGANGAPAEPLLSLTPPNEDFHPTPAPPQQAAADPAPSTPQASAAKRTPPAPDTSSDVQSPTAPPVPTLESPIGLTTPDHPPQPTTAPTVQTPVTLAMATPSPPPPKERIAPDAPPPTPVTAPGLPGPHTLAADPAPQSESESDPFSHEATADVFGGRLEARAGRKVKTVRPRFTLAGQIALASAANVSVTLKVDIDPRGKVTNVEVLQGTGTVAIDLPVQRAMYDWWIEPPKSPTGQPLADAMVWHIVFH